MSINTLSKGFFLLFFLLSAPVFANGMPTDPIPKEIVSMELKKSLDECVSSLPKSRNLLHLSNCLFQFRQLLVLSNIQSDRIAEFPDLLSIREEIDTSLSFFLSLMLTPQPNAQVPAIASKSIVYENSKQLIELLAILQFSPVKTREMLNEAIFSYNNLIILLGVIQSEQLESYPIINAIGVQLQQVRSSIK